MILYKIADKIIFNILKRISVGYLEITSISGELLKFGNYDDKLKADLKIKSSSLSYNLIKGGSVGLAECYMRDEFETSNLSNLIELAARNISIIHKFSGVLDLKFLNFIKNKFIKNTKSRSKENIAKHYDLGNDFFSLWLDKTLTYSSAIFDEQNKDLSKAQNNKYQKLINLIQPNTGDKVLEIGCGWGGFAEYLGKNYDVSTAVNVGKWDMNDVFLNRDSDELDGRPRGMGFSSDGMKLFVVEIMPGNGVDMINQFDLECPYGLAACVSDASASVVSQVELANQNISLNVSTIFKRFEWIKRNRNSNNLNNLNASIKFDNPMLNYWVKKLPTEIVSINGPVENGQSITIGSENKNSNNLNNFTTTIKSDNPLLSSWMNKLPENITALKASLKEKLGKNKKSNDFFYLDEDSQVLSLTKYCEWRNCEEKGEFKAPTSRDQLRVFKWFCLKHIKIYKM